MVFYVARTSYDTNQWLNKLIPFARRDDNDDIACFEVGKGQRIQIIHDFASEGYEQRGEYNSFGEWMKVMVDELIRNEEK